MSSVDSIGLAALLGNGCIFLLRMVYHFQDGIEWENTIVGLDIFVMVMSENTRAGATSAIAERDR